MSIKNSFLKESGLKITNAREGILSILMESNKPLIADDIYKKVKGDIDLATIYRTLDTFLKFNIVKKISLGGDSYFYEIIKDHHHHIVCKKCGLIEEFEDCEIKKIKPKAKMFNLIDEHSLEFFGFCKLCLK